MNKQGEPQWDKFLFVAQYDQVKATVEVLGDAKLSEVLDALEAFLIAAGFDPQQVKASLR